MVSISPKPDAHNEKQTFLLPPDLVGLIKDVTQAFDQAGYQVTFDDDVAHKLGQSIHKCLKDAEKNKILQGEEVGVLTARLATVTGSGRNKKP